jgi:hypothetical protein
MDWVLALLIICAILIGILGIATVLAFIFLGVESVWFQALAVAQGSFATLLTACLIISFVYILIING